MKLEKISFYIYNKEKNKLNQKLKDLGFEGRGALSSFIRKAIENEIIFINSKNVRIKIINGTEEKPQEC